MSTILDALKKIEQEHDTATNAGQKRQLNALQPATGSRWPMPGVPLIKWGLMALVLCSLVGLTLYFFQRDPQTPTQAEQGRAQTQPRPALTRDPAPPKPARTAKRAPINPPRIQRSLVDRQQQPNEQPASPKPSRRPFEQPEWAETVDRKNGANTPLKKAPVVQRPVIQPAPRRPSESQPPAPPRRPESNPPQPSATQRTATGATSHSMLDRLTDSSLKVQAIAWSPTPEERMAVINSKIVREGNSVDDYDIVAIDPDEVVVRKGGQMYRVIFGRP